MPPNDVPRAPPSGRVFGKRVVPADPAASPPSAPAFSPAASAARAPARAPVPSPDDEDAATELDAELVRADAHVRSASVGLWLVVIVAAVCALGFVAASLLMQG